MLKEPGLSKVGGGTDPGPPTDAQCQNVPLMDAEAPFCMWRGYGL